MEVAVYSCTDSFLPKPVHYLSTTDAHDALLSKKVVLLKDDFSFDYRWQTVCLIITALSFSAGLFTFFCSSNTKAHIDHSHDVKTTFQSKSTFCIRYEPFISKDCFYVNHTGDLWIPNIEAGLKDGVRIALAFPAFVLSTWLTVYISNKVLVKYGNHKISTANSEINDLILSLRSSAKIDHSIPTPDALIADLSRLNMLSGHFRFLSFSQINSLRKSDPIQFKTWLETESFSIQQNVYWKKLTKMLSANATDLLNAINKPSYNAYFLSEPRMLELLIQELEQEQMTEDVKEALALKLRGINNLMEKLEKQEILQIIALVSAKKYSLEMAYHKRSFAFLESKETINIQLTDKQNQMKTIEAPLRLLTATSSVFEHALQDTFTTDGKENFLLPEIDSDLFESLMSYLKTDQLDFNTPNLFPLLALGDKYDFVNLHQKVQALLCDNFHFFVEHYEIKFLLTACNDYQLNSFKQKIDLNISLNLPGFFGTSFFDTAKLIHIFDLAESRLRLLESLIKAFEELVSKAEFNSHFIKLVAIDPEWLERLWILFERSSEEKPLLLGALFEEASKEYCDVLLDKIVDFCNNPKNAHLYLANWDLPPVKATMDTDFEVIDFSNEI